MKEERKLTEKEKIRTEKIQKILDQKAEEGYARKDLTISISLANIMAIVLGLPFCALFFILFISQNTIDKNTHFLLLAISFVVFTIVHELIHGFFWGICVPHKFKSIEFGFIVEMLTPYCTCLEPLKKNQYIIGSIMPGLLLGFVPSLVSVWTGSFDLLLFGLIMIIGAGGDFTILLKLLSYKGKENTIYLDHPTECGLIVLEKESA
ncbi:MAG: DUF3267 domain-containing protein [Firmicutes bacterium]|nr:DUF3267 domain-containing protein [Bacillota bacterium]